MANLSTTERVSPYRARYRIRIAAPVKNDAIAWIPAGGKLQELHPMGLGRAFLYNIDQQTVRPQVRKEIGVSRGVRFEKNYRSI